MKNGVPRRDALAAARMQDASLLIVHVPLGDRAYDILVGRGLLATPARASPRLAPGPLRSSPTSMSARSMPNPSAKSLQQQGLRTSVITVAPGEASKSYASLARVCDAVLEARIERGRSGGRARRRRRGRSRGLRRRGRPARRALRAGSDDAARAGRFLRRRQDRDQLPARQEPRRRLPPAEPRARRYRRARHAAAARVARGLCRGGEIRPDRRCRVLRLVRSATGRACSRADRSATRRSAASCRAKAAVVVRDEREEGDRALLNLGHTFAHAFERITGYDGARLVHGEASRSASPARSGSPRPLGLCSRPGCRAGRTAPALRSGLPTRLRDVPGWDGDVDSLLDAMAQDKKVKAGRADLHPRARHRPELRRARHRSATAVRAFLESEIASARTMHGTATR